MSRIYVDLTLKHHEAESTGNYTPAMKNWVSAWAHRETVIQPDWAGGREVLRWLADAGADLPRKWGAEMGVLGRT